MAKIRVTSAESRWIHHGLKVLIEVRSVANILILESQEWQAGAAKGAGIEANKKFIFD